MDRSEQLIADSLSKHAADAPSDDRLLAGVHTRLRRRRTGRTIGAVVIAAAAVATAITATHLELRTDPQIAQNPQTGWRWESFRTVQVQVPARWTQYVSGPAPCTFLGNSAVPTIGRLNGWPASKVYTCNTAVLPLARRQPYLWFNDVQAPGIKRYDGGWTEETRVVGGVKLSVLTKDDVLRRTILGSARPITNTDYYGCTARQPADGPTGKPTAQITAASICEYWNGSLIAGSEVQSDKALALADQLLNASTPRPAPQPASCQDEAREYVIHLRADNQSWPVHVPYTVCSINNWPGLDLIRSGPHQQIQGADLFDPVKPIPSLPR
ncbi:hypothetical protein EV645_5054 [Kribbella rubisoli]|uniref:Uncharacterized protein n=1 Tax=Kribbella rubisoli TaxID=3075929 RepID=A0A4Q7WV50_9ACTN|nr:hypothetical protein [Kribbella rubisoli]RZU14190.1 hypothetical protein EV645_5054 [Kribbella rubisoli]